MELVARRLAVKTPSNQNRDTACLSGVSWFEFPLLTGGFLPPSLPSRRSRWMGLCRQCNTRRGKIVYRQVQAPVGLLPNQKAAHFGGNLHVGFAPLGHQNSRSDARARRAAVGADAGRSRRRGDQDRTAGRRRRRARLRPALSGRSRGQGEQQQLVLSVRQPQQEVGHRQYRLAGRPGTSSANWQNPATS